MDWTLLLSGIGVAFSAIGTAVAAWAVRVSAETAREQTRLARRIHEDSMRLSQRQLFVDVWPVFSQLKSVDPKDPVEPDVVAAVNALELFAVCWEAQMVDAAVLRRTFGERYRELYDLVDAVPKMEKLNKSGRDLLRENPACGKLYKTLSTLVEEEGAPPPLVGDGHVPKLPGRRNVEDEDGPESQA